jgi:hypothetical protein
MEKAPGMLHQPKNLGGQMMATDSVSSGQVTGKFIELCRTFCGESR